MQEAVFVVGEEGVRHPNLLGEITAQGQLKILRREGQSFIFPILIEVEGQSIILNNGEKRKIILSSSKIETCELDDGQNKFIMACLEIGGNLTTPRQGKLAKEKKA